MFTYSDHVAMLPFFLYRGDSITVTAFALEGVSTSVASDPSNSAIAAEEKRLAAPLPDYPGSAIRGILDRSLEEQLPDNSQEQHYWYLQFEAVLQTHAGEHTTYLGRDEDAFHQFVLFAAALRNALNQPSVYQQDYLPYFLEEAYECLLAVEFLERAFTDQRCIRFLSEAGRRDLGHDPVMLADQNFQLLLDFKSPEADERALYCKYCRNEASWDDLVTYYASHECFYAARRAYQFCLAGRVKDAWNLLTASMTKYQHADCLLTYLMEEVQYATGAAFLELQSWRLLSQDFRELLLHQSLDPKRLVPVPATHMLWIALSELEFENDFWSFLTVLLVRLVSYRYICKHPELAPDTNVHLLYSRLVHDRLTRRELLVFAVDFFRSVGYPLNPRIDPSGDIDPMYEVSDEFRSCLFMKCVRYVPDLVQARVSISDRPLRVCVPRELLIEIQTEAIENGAEPARVFADESEYEEDEYEDEF